MTSPDGPLVCLLPVRNGESHLPEYLDCVGRFADAVVALDDGSTDATPALLAASPLVARLLANPVRPGYAGWDDGANRNRLLAAAAELGAGWILSLDVDERMDAADGVALRAFTRDGARRDCAYLLPLFDAVGTATRVAVAPRWVARLFAPAPGHAFAHDRLHGKPIPHGIPRRRWVKTTLRIRHLGPISPEARSERYRKYEAVDPERRWQRSYEHLLETPPEVMTWAARPPALPAVRHHPVAAPPGEAGAPLISAIVIATADEDRIVAAVGALQASSGLALDAFEVIVVCSGSEPTAAIVRERFPGVRLIALPRRVLPGAARNAGLRVARGHYVAFPGSHQTVGPGTLAAFVAAHERGYALVMGSMANGTPTRAGWASYLLDNHTTLPARPAGPAADPPVRCSYLRSALLAAGPFPEDRRTAEETEINTWLFRLGYGAWREPAAVATHHSPCTSTGRLLRHHFHRGRGFAHVLMGMRRGDSAAVAVGLNLTAGPARRLLLAIIAALRWGGADRAALLGALPWAVLAAAASWAGTISQLVRLRSPQGRTRARAAAGR